jgi:hypothetical protein
VIQNCGKLRACASHRPRSFQLYQHTRINDIWWRRYTSTRAVGLGWFGQAKHVCNGHVPAAKDTCVLMRVATVVLVLAAAAMAVTFVLMIAGYH